MTKEQKRRYRVVGVMSGSSMDGLDIVDVEFTPVDNSWDFDIKKAATIELNQEWYNKLRNAIGRPELWESLDSGYGEWIGQKLKEFGVDEVDFIAVHGHTIQHDLEKKISWQLGNGKVISEISDKPTINDFRSKDIYLGGQGAPLVPIGDFSLFSSYDACLNLGGIANVSIKKNKTAWDITPCNQVLNFFANKLGQAYDKDGYLARQGNIDLDWISEIAQIEYFHLSPPKSLSNNFISKELIERIDPYNGLRSFTHFVAEKIYQDVYDNTGDNSKILVTGGGAHNSFLIQLLKEKALIKKSEFEIPNKIIIEYKEALIFAFMGVLRIRNEINVLSSVTGASADSSSGRIHYP